MCVVTPGLWVRYLETSSAKEIFSQVCSNQASRKQTHVLHVSVCMPVYTYSYIWVSVYISIYTELSSSVVGLGAGASVYVSIFMTVYTS